MLLVLAIVAGLAWLLGFAVFHVATGSIHLLLAVAVIAAIAYVARSARTGRGGSALP